MDRLYRSRGSYRPLMDADDTVKCMSDLGTCSGAVHPCCRHSSFCPGGMLHLSRDPERRPRLRSCGSTGYLSSSTLSMPEVDWRRRARSTATRPTVVWERHGRQLLGKSLGEVQGGTAALPGGLFLGGSGMAAATRHPDRIRAERSGDAHTSGSRRPLGERHRPQPGDCRCAPVALARHRQPEMLVRDSP